jgi:hypothetical protein
MVDAKKRRKIMNKLPDTLPYPTRIIKLANGEEIAEYIIPDEAKQEVLDALYPFYPVPKLDDVFEDIHANMKFMVKDYKVILDRGHLFIMSPYWQEYGSSVIDWCK